MTLQGFLKAILAEPDVPLHKHAYADWLIEQGHERHAELVRMLVIGTWEFVFQPHGDPYAPSAWVLAQPGFHDAFSTRFAEVQRRPGCRLQWYWYVGMRSNYSDYEPSRVCAMRAAEAFLLRHTGYMCPCEFVPWLRGRLGDNDRA